MFSYLKLISVLGLLQGLLAIPAVTGQLAQIFIGSIIAKVMVKKVCRPSSCAGTRSTCSRKACHADTVSSYPTALPSFTLLSAGGVATCQLAHAVTS